MSVRVVEGDLPADVVEALRQSPVVGVDTETSGLDWRNARLEVCQVFSKNVGAVILHQVEGFPAGLAEVLGDSAPLKVFHFAPFDLRFLRAAWRVEATNVACTKAASKLARPDLPPSEHSLGSLTARYLGVSLDKGEVRTSDWGASALSDRQLEYASADVRHLPDLLDALLGELKRGNRLADYWQVCRFMATAARLETSGVPDPLHY